MPKMNTAKATKILQAAFDQVSEELGLERVAVDIREFTRNQGLRVMKTDMMVAARAAAQQVSEDVPSALKAAMKVHNIASDTNSKGDRLTGYKASRPKYPFEYTSVRGTRWKASAKQMQVRFGRA